MSTADPLFSVADQVVLVSGGTRGIGWALAQGFAERGAHVVLVGRKGEVAQNRAAELVGSHPAWGIGCDVSHPDQVEKLVAAILERTGRIDCLVNVAGMNRRKPAEKFPLTDFDELMSLNVRGAFWMARCVGQHMLERGSGTQIQVASITSHRPLKDVTPYAMSKAALASMTRSLALEWGPRGVRVNALAPGFIHTDLTSKLWSNPEMQAWGRTVTPLGRLGQPADLVGTAIFLAAPASSFMTGQVVYVDGGFTSGWNWPIPADGGN